MSTLTVHPGPGLRKAPVRPFACLVYTTSSPLPHAACLASHIGTVTPTRCSAPPPARWQRLRSLDRASALQRNVRVVKPQPVELLAGLVDGLYNSQVGARRQCGDGDGARSAGLQVLAGLVQTRRWCT